MSQPTKQRAIVSACLVGKACRYDGRSKETERVQRWVKTQGENGIDVVPVCPEELGGLGTPRPAAHLVGGDGAAVLQGNARVKTDSRDVTEAFVSGATHAADAGAGASIAVLKSRSPSCGCGQVWRDGAVRSGDGVFAALLKSRGIQVQTDEDLS